MPEYRAPGVYVKETSFRNKTIEGVSTSTAGFIGPARFGPHVGEPELLTSFNDFERVYGGLDQLEFDGQTFHNYLAHAVRAFFEEGGKRRYVARAVAQTATRAFGLVPEPALALTSLPSAVPASSLLVAARHRGAAGNVVVQFTFRAGPDILHRDEQKRPELRGASDFDVVMLGSVPGLGSFQASPSRAGQIFWLDRFLDAATNTYNFRLRDDAPSSSSGAALLASELDPDQETAHVITVQVSVGAMGERMAPTTWEGLALHPEHKRSLQRVFDSDPDRTTRATRLFVPIVFETDLTNGAEIAEVLFAMTPTDQLLPRIPPQVASPPDFSTIREALLNPQSRDADRSFSIRLALGTDGEFPDVTAYAGEKDGAGFKSGLLALEDLEEISIVAAPGATVNYRNREDQSDTITRLLISHCERMRYRIGVLDSAQGHLMSEVRNYRGQLDSKCAALYYPWICVLDPVTGQEIKLPPSGFVAGIYARNDIEHGVHKAPANEAVRLAVGFEFLLNKAQQEALNPEGVNCFRFFEGRGYRLWGARTISSDPEWKYVNLRRYFAFLEHSIDKGTQWVDFENNSEPLWANVRSTIEDFLYNEWKSEHLIGESPKEAHFVKCDRSTMTQNDIDNGRLVCLVGVAPVRPAEFVMFRVGQWTATRRG